jgi:hypothetical protein
VELVRLILRVALAATAIGLILEFTLPASSSFIDAAAALCALANWIVPLLMLARTAYRPPRTSLGSVEVTISIFAVAACLSVAGLSFALLTLIFARGGDWAWLALATIAAFWLSCAALIGIGGSPFLRPAGASAARSARRADPARGRAAPDAAQKPTRVSV